MSELLLDSKLVDVSRGNLDRLEKRAKNVERELAEGRKEMTWLVASMVKTFRQFEETWEKVKRYVVAGQTEEAQAVRGQLGALFHEAFTQLQSTLELCQRWAPLGGPNPDELVDTGILAKRLKKIFDRWNTAEDLEDLVAEATAPTEEECDAVVRRFGPPTAWFDQGKPGA